MQDVESPPTCNECGHQNKISWKEIIQQADIIGMKRGGSSKKTMMGTIDAVVAFEALSSAPCFHCKQPLPKLHEPEKSNIECEFCHQHLSFTKLSGMEDFVFYRSGNSVPEGIKPIAVRCVSCGAPLEVDPTRNNFTCKFCSTDNILPMAMRYKVVLDDIYLGEMVSSYPKMLAFQQDGKVVMQSLRENGKASFQDSELDQILLTNLNSFGVYNMITDEYKYLPSDKVLNELFNKSTHEEIIKRTGLRLQKSDEEIQARIPLQKPAVSLKEVMQVKSNVKPVTTVKEFNKPKKNFIQREWPYILIFIVLLLLWMIFGESFFS